MKSNKTKSAMTALVVAAMVCTAAMPIKAAEAKWVNDNGTWSYVKEDGSKAKGWIKDDGCWYAFDENGSMRTGWVASHEHWYFMGESGVMQSNAWVEDNGARYFIKGTGVMAKDYVKDGYELTSDGKAIPLAETNSVVVTDPSAVEGQVIEGNLYVDVTTAKELELKGVTVKGKLVIIGDNQTAGKVTVTDSKIEAISTQTRNAEVVLSGETAVKEIVIEETSAVTPDKNFKGEVEKIEVQSTTKGEIKIEVPAQEVSTRTYASVDIQAPVEHLEVKTDTQVKVNADVKNVVVTESAKDTKVEISKGNTVGTIVADAPVKIEGSGTIEKVEANVDGVEAGKDTIIKDVETGKDVTTAPEVSKPEKPSTGGGSTGGSGGTETRPTIKNLTVKKIEGLQAPEEAVYNQEAISITAEENVYKVRSNNTLKTYASSNSAQGEGQWIGFILDTGESSIIGLSVDTGNGWYEFTEADVAEAATVNATSGKFVFWLKANEKPTRTVKVKKGSNGIEKEVTIKYSCLVDLATKAKENFAAKLNNTMDWDTVITAAYYQSELSNAAVEDETLKEALNTLNSYYKSVEKLNLSGETSSKYDISTGALTMFTGLKELNLSRTGISELGGLVDLRSLEKLDVSSNRLKTETNDDRLGALANLTSLKELNLSNNIGITALSAIAGLSKLTSLDISSTSISDFNVFWISKVGVEGEPRFADLTNLQAKNIQSLESIAGLVEIACKEGFDAKDKIWNLSDSVLKSDEDGHITMISDKFTNGSFTAPSVFSNNGEGLKEIKNISLSPNEDGYHVIDFDSIDGTKLYKVSLIDVDNSSVEENYFSSDSKDSIKLELVISRPVQSEKIKTIKIEAFDDNDELLAQGYMNISLALRLYEAKSDFTALLDENDNLILKSEAFKELKRGDTVIISSHCTCDDNNHRPNGSVLEFPVVESTGDVLTFAHWSNNEHHTGWNVRVMILEKTIHENEMYIINIVRFNNGQEQVVTMPNTVDNIAN